MELGGEIDPQLPDPTPLNLTASELNLLVNGFTDITIGGSDTNASLNIVNNLTFQDPVTLRSPGINGSISMYNFALPSVTLTGDTSITFQAGESIFLSDAILTSSGAPININLNSDRDGSGTGAITISGSNASSNLASNGGNINLFGGSSDFSGLDLSNPTDLSTVTGFAGGTTSYYNGVTMSNTSLNAGGGNINILGRGFNLTGIDVPIASRGINLSADSQLTTIGNGTILLLGIGGTWGRINRDGVGLLGNISAGISADNGAGNGTVTIVGQGSSFGTAAQVTSNSGVLLTGTIAITGGEIKLKGTGGSGTDDFGVGILGSGQIQGTGVVNLTGTGGTGTDNNDGIHVEGVVQGNTVTLQGDSHTSTGTGNEAIELTNTANIQTTGTGSIVLNSDRPQANQGAIVVNTNLSTTGGDISSSAGGDIIVNGTIATQGGDVNFDSDGSITTQGIQTDSFTGTAGSVTLTAIQNINTANVDASALNSTGNGGTVRLQAGDQMTVADINTNALGTANAGNITLIATNSITAGNLAATSQRGAGGDIFLDPIGDILLKTAQATGATAGGDITLISTGGKVFASEVLASARLGALCEGASLCTNGTGTVFIQHGITDPFDPNAFRIGNPLLNGTTGTIVTGVGTLQDFIIPNRPGIVTAVNVSITPGGFPPPPPTPPPPTPPPPTPPPPTPTPPPPIPPPPRPADPELPGLEDRIVAGCPPECDFQDTKGTPPAPLDISYNILQDSIRAADERYTQEFTSYFGLAGRPLPTLQQLQQDLRTVEKDTGIKPAILFAILAPPTSSPTDPLKEGRDTRQGSGQPAPISEPALGRSSSPAQPNQGNAPAPIQRLGGVNVILPSRSVPAQSSQGQPDDELEIVVITPNDTPIRQRVSGVTRSQMMRATALLRQEVSMPGNTDSDRYLQIAQRLYDWIVRPVEAELQARNVESIAFVLEPGMRSLPLATLYDGHQFIIEKYSVGLMPNLSLTDTRYRDVRDFALLGMGASTFTTQAPLPTVPVEVNTLTQEIWPSSEEYLNDRFTVAELKKQSDRFGIIHLATHADFVQGTPEGSYVQLSDGRLNLTQLRELGWASRNTEENPPVELLTLSACRTAVGVAEDSPEAIIGSELGFAGVAFAAGVKTSLASLWYVSDAATAALMTEFYQTLAQMDVYRSGILNPELKPNTIAPLKAEALRQTQLALLRGDLQIQGDTLQGLRGSVNSLVLPPESITALGNDRIFTHPYYWAAFTLIGNPW